MPATLQSPAQRNQRVCCVASPQKRQFIGCKNAPGRVICPNDGHETQSATTVENVDERCSAQSATEVDGIRPDLTDRPENPRMIPLAEQKAMFMGPEARQDSK